MKIKPLGTRIQIEIDEPKAGILDLSSLQSAVEIGKVVALGDDVTLPLKVGDKVFFKAWAVDIIITNGKKYYFIDQTTHGICATVR